MDGRANTPLGVAAPVLIAPDLAGCILPSLATDAVTMSDMGGRSELRVPARSPAVAWTVGNDGTMATPLSCAGGPRLAFGGRDERPAHLFPSFDVLVCEAGRDRLAGGRAPLHQ